MKFTPLFETATQDEIGALRMLVGARKWPFSGMEVGACINVKGRENFARAIDAYKSASKRHGMKFSRATYGDSMLIERIA